MNVLIVGQNKCNAHVSSYFAQKGCNPVTLEDVYQLRSLGGEIGDFIADTKTGGLETELVVLTEQPAAPPPEIAGVRTRSLYEDGKAVIGPKTDRLEPLVFLLDYVCESPMAATVRALSDATELARNKRKVYYLAKFIRTAGKGVEALYQQARSVGVTFVKYEDLCITADEDAEVFSIKASDGVFDVQIETKTIYADGCSCKTGDRFAYAADKLNLTTNADGFLLEDTYYLTPVLTSRRGVYHISRDLLAERLDEGLDYIYASAMSGDFEPSHGVAVVDGQKCVLCYNCYRACTHAALEPDLLARQMVELYGACQGCGTCASICPGNAITLEGDPDYTRAAEKSGKTLVFCCENSASIAMEKALPMLGRLAENIETCAVPCGGRISFEQLSGELLDYDKVAVAVCPDDACQHFDGNKRACRQAERLGQMLESAGLCAQRVGRIKVSHAMPGILRDELAHLIRGERD